MFNKYLIGSVIWALFILVLTLTPGKSVPDISLFSYDKLGHGFVFFVLAFLLISGFYQSLISSSKHRAASVGVILSVLYGLSLEVAQSMVPDRSMEFYDALANTIGSFLGLAVFYIRIKLKA